MPNDVSLGWLEGFCVRPSRRAKHVRLKVIPPGRVEVVVPSGFDQRQLPVLLARHEGWLSRTVEKVRNDYGGPQEVTAPPTVSLAAVGAHYRVEYRPGSPQSRCTTLADATLRVHHRDARGWRDALRTWLANQGRTHLTPWLERVSRETGLSYGRVTIRTQKTRWGSCSARNNISLNCGLLFLPPPLVRYLLIHELSHTIHLNHSLRFWSLVEQLEPDYRRLDEQLRVAARDVPAWARRD